MAENWSPINVATTSGSVGSTRALELAREALAAQEVPVGCVFVADGRVVAEGRNRVNETRNPTRHAEINCIDNILQNCQNTNEDYQKFFRNVSVYVTCEPCIMCAATLNNLKIKSVVYGCANDRFGGMTVLDVGQFYNNAYSVAGDCLGEEAMSLLKLFYKGTNPNAPEEKVKLKSIDTE